MRHTPCGCRSAYLAQVQPNHYLPIVPTNAASAAMLPWQAPASPITSEVDGNCVRPTNRRQSGSEDRSKSNRLDTKNSRHSIPQAAQLFKRPTANAGIEGDSPRLPLGDQKGVFSSEREYPLWCRGAHAAPPPALARENQGTPLEKGVKKTRHNCGRSFSELISNNACCGSYGRPRSSCGA